MHCARRYNNVGFKHGPLQQGNPEMRTPNMDALASQGIVLERHVRALRVVIVSCAAVIA